MPIVTPLGSVQIPGNTTRSKDSHLCSDNVSLPTVLQPSQQDVQRKETLGADAFSFPAASCLPIAFRVPVLFSSTHAAQPALSATLAHTESPTPASLCEYENIPPVQLCAPGTAQNGSFTAPTLPYPYLAAVEPLLNDCQSKFLYYQAVPDANPTGLFNAWNMQQPLVPYAPKPRQRSAQACQKCRVKKSKCCGGRPCGRCRKRGLECEYEEKPSIRGKDKQEPSVDSRGGRSVSASSRGKHRHQPYSSSANSCREASPSKQVPFGPSMTDNSADGKTWVPDLLGLPSLQQALQVAIGLDNANTSQVHGSPMHASAFFNGDSVTSVESDMEMSSMVEIPGTWIMQQPNGKQAGIACGENAPDGRTGSQSRERITSTSSSLSEYALQDSSIEGTLLLKSSSATPQSPDDDAIPSTPSSSRSWVYDYPSAPFPSLDFIPLPPRDSTSISQPSYTDPGLILYTNAQSDQTRDFAAILDGMFSANYVASLVKSEVTPSSSFTLDFDEYIDFSPDTNRSQARIIASGNSPLRGSLFVDIVA